MLNGSMHMQTDMEFKRFLLGEIERIDERMTSLDFF